MTNPIAGTPVPQRGDSSPGETERRADASGLVPVRPLKADRGGGWAEPLGCLVGGAIWLGAWALIPFAMFGLAMATDAGPNAADSSKWIIPALAFGGPALGILVFRLIAGVGDGGDRPWTT